MKRFTALAVQRLTEIGLHPDGDGLYLQITKGSRGLAKSWFYRFSLGGHERRMGLGSLANTSLAEAREKAAQARKLRAAGKDPIVARDQQRADARLESAKAMSFDDCAAAYIRSHEAGWRNPKHRLQWTSTLATYVSPVFGSLPVQTIDTGLVMKVLQPIWSTKSETAGRIRGRIETILDWAKVSGLRNGENAARWRGHLNHLLPDKAKIHRVQHHAALPFAELPEFMMELHKRAGLAALATEFTILTASRVGEVIGAEWSEFTDSLWTIPPQRMKGGREHRVPLCRRAVEILRDLPREQAPFKLSNMAMPTLLRRMGRRDITVHGFRSTFRDWAAERTNYPNHVVEMALAHAVGDKVEAAYRRGDLFEKRARLMSEWGRFAAGAATGRGAVVSMTKK